MQSWEYLTDLMKELAPPLRPAAVDVEFLLASIQPLLQSANRGRSLRVLVLGATPGFRALPWPAGTQLLIVDFSSNMLQQFWPGPPGETLCSNWLDLTPEYGPFDLVLGDGWLYQLRWPEQQLSIVKILHRLMRPDGLLVSRFFVRDSIHENFDAAFAALSALPSRSKDLVKLRLWLASQSTTAQGSRPADSWLQLRQRLPELWQLAAFVGQSEATTQSHTELYQQADQRCFHFATLDLVKALFCQMPGGFGLQAEFSPSYPLGQYCPSLVFRANPASDPGT